MKSLQITSQKDLKHFFETSQKEICKIAEEVVKREWELLEFNLFLSASGKNHLKRALNDVKKLRKNLWKEAEKKAAGDELKALKIYEEMIEN